jgi:hypothetical protein
MYFNSIWMNAVYRRIILNFKICVSTNKKLSEYILQYKTISNLSSVLNIKRGILILRDVCTMSMITSFDANKWYFVFDKIYEKAKSIQLILQLLYKGLFRTLRNYCFYLSLLYHRENFYNCWFCLLTQRNIISPD